MSLVCIVLDASAGGFKCRQVSLMSTTHNVDLSFCFFSQTEPDISVLAETQFGEMPSPTSLSHWSLHCPGYDDDDEGARSVFNCSVDTLVLFRQILHCFYFYLNYVNILNSCKAKWNVIHLVHSVYTFALHVLFSFIIFCTESWWRHIILANCAHCHGQPCLVNIWQPR